MSRNIVSYNFFFKVIKNNIPAHKKKNILYDLSNNFTNIQYKNNIKKKNILFYLLNNIINVCNLI